MDRCVGCDDETCAATLGAGMDNDCGDFFGGKNGSLNRAIHDGSVTTAMREKALGNLIRVQMRLGMWDDDSEQPYRRYGTEMVDTSEHRALALEAARQGMVRETNSMCFLYKFTGKTERTIILPFAGTSQKSQWCAATVKKPREDSGSTRTTLQRN